MNVLEGLLDFIQRLLMKRALNVDIPEDVCVACDSSELTNLAGGVYRCDACGYEGGPGYAKYKQSQQHVGYDKLAPQERHRLAVEKLEEASTLLLAGTGDLKNALEASMRDRRSDYEDHDEDKRDDLISAYRVLIEAESLIHDAAYLLDESFAARPFVADVMEVAISSMHSIIDVRNFDRSLHTKIEMAHHEAEALLKWSRRTSEHVRNSPPLPRSNANAQEDSALW